MTTAEVVRLVLTAAISLLFGSVTTALYLVSKLSDRVTRIEVQMDNLGKIVDRRLNAT